MPKGRPKGSKNKPKTDIPEQGIKQAAKTVTKESKELIKEPAKEFVDELILDGKYKITRNDDKNILIEELKSCQIYESKEEGKGRGKPIEGSFEERWVFAGYTPNLEFAFKFLLKHVGLRAKGQINRYLEELEDLRAFIETNINKQL